MSEVATELVPVTTRVSREIADELEELARRNERSVAAELRLAIQYRLAQFAPPDVPAVVGKKS